MTRQRMTAQSKVNIKAAKAAHLEPDDGGYKVRLIGNNGSCYIENAAGAIVYSSMSAAKIAVAAHNKAVEPELLPTI